MNMKHFTLLTYIFSIAIAFMVSVDSYAQFYVVKDGKVIFSMDKIMPDYVTFEDPNSDPLKKYAFTVGVDKKVRFSKGNLWYRNVVDDGDYNYEWKFAEHQYDVIAERNGNISSTYTNWIDLFGWGTAYTIESGGRFYPVYNTSTEPSDYFIFGNPGNGFESDNYDWYDWGSNDIINADYTDVWRTLSADEWNYLLRQRTSAVEKFALATVCGQTGLIVLPDEWHCPDGILFVPSTEKSIDPVTYVDESLIGDAFKDNVYLSDQWKEMENAGAVFLPAGGYRSGTKVSNVSNYGYYWSSSAMADRNGINAHALTFSKITVTPHGEWNRSYGCNVRVVMDITE